MGRVLSLTTLLVLVFWASAFLGGHHFAAADATPCSAAPQSGSIRIRFRLEAGEERVRPRSRAKTAKIVCRRLRGAGLVGAQVQNLPGRQIGISLSRAESISNVTRALELATEPGRLHFYDWEANLIGREATIGGHPGFTPPVDVLRRAEREWSAAGRSPGSPENAQLLLAGAYPTAYRAIEFASRQRYRRCSSCSASTPRLYLFDSRTHRLLAGPAASRARLDTEAADGGHPAGGLVLRVPVGTVVVLEHPSNALGGVDLAAPPGWFVLKDRPALNASDIVDPEQSYGSVNEPIVSFGFTDGGGDAFEQVTREIAERGQASAVGHVSDEAAAALSGHFAVVFESEVVTRPIINFVENPDGIDGRNGAQISGGFANIAEAQRLARILRSGSLPLDLAILKVRKPA